MRPNRRNGRDWQLPSRRGDGKITHDVVALQSTGFLPDFDADRFGDRRAEGWLPMNMNNPDTASTRGPARLKPAGDMAILVEFGQTYDPVVNHAVLGFDAALVGNLPAGVIETVPSFRSVLVRFDPLELAYERLHEFLQQRLEATAWYSAVPPETGKNWVLPVVYGGDEGPHLAEVADLCGLREDQVADQHAARELTVAMLGFAPGLAYLGQLPEIWQIARRAEITPTVPAGAVLVAVRQTVLPATPIPTGWHQIGRTPFRGFDPAAARPFLLSPGDRVRFEPTDAATAAGFEPGAAWREAMR